MMKDEGGELNLTLKAASVPALGPSADIIATLLAASNPKHLAGVSPASCLRFICTHINDYDNLLMVLLTCS